MCSVLAFARPEGFEAQSVLRCVNPIWMSPHRLLIHKGEVDVN